MFDAKLKQQIADLTARLDAACGEAAKLRVKLEEAEEVAAAMVEPSTMATLVNRKVNSVLASIGVTQFADEKFTASAAQTKAGILAKFNSLPVEEQTAYYQANKSAITLALNGTQ